MYTIGERIKNRRKTLGLSATKLSEIIGVDRATIYRYESNYIKKLPTTTLEPLAKALQTTPAWLMGIDEPPVEEINPLFSHKNIKPIKKRRVPLLGKIAAGQPIYADEDHESYVDCDANERVDFAVQVEGDSMIGARINDGDIVFIREQADVEDGEIAAVLIDDDATLKRVYHQKNAVMLVSENPKYPPMIFSAENCTTCRILGKAIFFQSDVV